ncbi:helix-turn-helix domain-containing protein [Pedobacter antarcticus]|uniref:helix-turn-helix domain-containing protein n=1 Tax=Pedobacter antarcticus TaxID=34086 RepID=UPI00088EAD38|nr:AraC family transcriptional regulator [Pedobacter antarcticus]SDM16943.1 AraC-type DNA-binding protein [Pedobacter antarcticus]
MQRNWRFIFFKKLEPKAYINYLKRKESYSNLSSEGHAYSNLHFTWSDIYYEQINEGFWLFSMETEERRDTCYVFQPKKSMKNYYSINYYHSTGKLGYEANGSLLWTNKVVIFANPDTTHKIYLRKGMILKCCRLVFTQDYLDKLIDLSAGDLSDFDLAKTILGTHAAYSRNIEESENIILRRLHYIQKHERKNFDYHLSVIKSAYEITDTFFKLSFPKTSADLSLRDKSDVMARAAILLERHIQDKFPGIAALAEDCHVSPTKLKSHFKKTYKVTPLEYFRRLQMIYAMDMLQKKELKIKDLSLNLGFKKSSTFNFWFKKTTGKHASEI